MKAFINLQFLTNTLTLNNKHETLKAVNQIEKQITF